MHGCKRSIQLARAELINVIYKVTRRGGGGSPREHPGVDGITSPGAGWEVVMPRVAGAGRQSVIR